MSYRFEFNPFNQNSTLNYTGEERNDPREENVRGQNLEHHQVIRCFGRRELDKVADWVTGTDLTSIVFLRKFRE